VSGAGKNGHARTYAGTGYASLERVKRARG
jgi:hypothetical protein